MKLAPFGGMMADRCTCHEEEASRPVLKTNHDAAVESAIQDSIRKALEQPRYLSVEKKQPPASAPEKGDAQMSQRFNTIDEAAEKAQFASSRELQREFFNSEAGYLAYRRAEVRGVALTAPAPQPGSPDQDLFIGRGQIDEVKAKLRFTADKNLQAEFYYSEGAYLAYLKAESRGEIKTVRTY